MTKRNAKDYVPAPSIEPALAPRVQAVLGALTGTTKVTEAARAVSLSRNRFQTVMHRGLEALVEAVTPGQAGRPARSAREVELEVENTRLRRENARLTERVEMTDRLLGAAGDLLRGTKATPSSSRPRPRTRRSTTTTTEATGKDDDDDPRARVVALANHARRGGLRRRTLAHVVGVVSSTLWRWRHHGLPRRSDSSTGARRSPISADVAALVAAHVRATRGLAGAEALRRSCPGVSRRQASALKRAELTAMERDRLANLSRVEVRAPGVVRGFDAVHLCAGGERCFLLASADGCVPFRTSAPIVPSYDGEAVLRALERDFREHGAPLVLRLDRASVHRTPQVRAMLDAEGVLALHGPPHLARFYGQLERQNREHRAWFDATAPHDMAALERERAAMLVAVNLLWRRRALAWRTPAEAWHARTELRVDRTDLRRQVGERVARWRRERPCDRVGDDTLERVAIERTLVEYGYLRVTLPGRCQENPNQTIMQ